MDPTPVSASVILALLVIFFSVNLQNLLKNLETRRAKYPYAEIPSPRNIFTGLAMIGTVVFFLEEVIYIILGYTECVTFLDFPILDINKSLSKIISYLGLSLDAFGVYIFLWSVVERGHYSVSWEMPKDHKLVTTGPYRYIRHPSYAGYFIMFFGFTLLWQNLITLIPWIAIIGYVKLVETEEKLLLTRFGTIYREYMDITGRFIPKIGYFTISSEK